MKEINGLKYSKKEFDGYKFRAIVTLITIDDEVRVEVYTTNTDRFDFQNILIETTSKKVISLYIEHWSSKEMDDAASELIDEWLNEVI